MLRNPRNRKLTDTTSYTTGSRKLPQEFPMVNVYNVGTGHGHNVGTVFLIDDNGAFFLGASNTESCPCCFDGYIWETIREAVLWGRRFGKITEKVRWIGKRHSMFSDQHHTADFELGSIEDLSEEALIAFNTAKSEC